MISFFFKRPEVVLDCFTSLAPAYDHAKINHAVQYMPDWWKSTRSNDDASSFENNTAASIKQCHGLIELYKTGIVLPSWFEMDIVLKDGGWTWTSSNTYMNTDLSHPSSQFSNFALDDGQNIKITSPWKLKTKELVNFAWSQPTWSMRDYLQHLTVLPAVVDFKYQNATNINYFVLDPKQTEDVKIHIPALTPLVMMHPLTDKKIVIKNHLVSEDDMLRVDNVNTLFIGSKLGGTYRNRKRMTDLSERTGCPYSGSSK